MGKKNDEYNVSEILSNVHPTPVSENGLSDQEKIDIIEEKFTDIMNTLGLDLTNDSLKESPKRVAKMFVNEWFQGLSQKNFPKITVIDNEMSYDQMIIEKNISVKSVCEHHFVIIDGVAHVSYIPRKKVIGISKLNRIVNYFSRRPQVQERLTKQIADCLAYILETPDVAVYLDAKHYCVISRGIEDINSTTATVDLRGEYRNSGETRSEFMSICRNHQG